MTPSHSNILAFAISIEGWIMGYEVRGRHRGAS